jgi:NAD(P) transhydrogenase subunit alpha
MKVGVPKEAAAEERRVALVPESVAKLVQSGVEVFIQSGAGQGAYFSDQQYNKAGASILSDVNTLYQSCEVILKVQKPVVDNSSNLNEVELLSSGSVLISFLQPLNSPELVKKLADKNVTSFSMEMIPRIARAQKMDALTSMSSVAGYKAALLAAEHLGKFFPMMMTAAGTIPPAKGLVLGAGVAGLQAIATARRLGAVMFGYDIRPAVKEQVQSLGATFIEAAPLSAEAEDKGGYAKELAKDAQERERQLLHRHVKDMDFVITTALIPGKRAPILVTSDMVRDMRPGSVIIDIAAEMGGNCELTKPGEAIEDYGVIIHGPLNLPSAMPIHASTMYSRNISSLLQHLVKDKKLNLDFNDEITKGCCITHQGGIVNQAIQALVKV